MNFSESFGYYYESHKKYMQEIKKSEQLTPKEYGMRIQGKKKRKKKKR